MILLFDSLFLFLFVRRQIHRTPILFMIYLRLKFTIAKQSGSSVIFLLYFFSKVIFFTSFYSTNRKLVITQLFGVSKWKVHFIDMKIIL